jgi:biopolymer transport protein ExbD
MAQVEESGGGDKKGKKGRGKKHSPNVDMTPMVDLAFLLITFFMLTTTFSKPQTMQLNMPDKTETHEKSEAKASESLTLLLAEKDKIYWFQGIPDENAKLATVDYSSEGLRKLILDKTREIGKDAKGVNKIVILIKPMDKSKYKNTVDVLDEMNITLSQKYAIVDLIPEEKALAAKYEASNL